MATLKNTTVQGNLSATEGTGQGFVPFGGIVALHSGMTGAHSVPSAAAVDSSGFMICDGSTIPGSQVLSGSVPDLTDGRFLRGNTHGNVGATSGVDSHSLVEANTLAHTHTGPSHTHTGPAHTHDGPSHTHTGPDHSHSGPNHSHTFSENRNYGQNVNTNAGNHTHGFAYGRWLTGPASGYAMADAGHPGGPDHSSSNGSHGHNFNFSQNQNYGGGTNNSGTGASGSSGDGATAAEGTGATTSAGGAATAAGGTGASGTYGSNPVTAVPTLPKYMHCVYLIRVK